VATYAGTPGGFIDRVMAGSIDAYAATTITANLTTFEPATALTPRVVRVVCDGNSLTLDYANELRTMLIASQASHQTTICHVINSGTGSATTNDMIAAFAAEVSPFYNPDMDCWLLFCELTNQIAQAGVNGTAAAVKASAESYMATARAAGWIVVYVNPTGRASVTDPGYDASLSAWSNAGEKAIYDEVCAYFLAHPELYDMVIDLAAVPELANPLNTTYYQTDGVHNTAAGITAKAQAVHDAMIEVL
jgi:lysophospholipase L1-like esterase